MLVLENQTPLSDGFRMPGEYEPHEGCWMLWPERGDTWRMGAVPAQRAYTEVAEAISRFEPVTVGVSGRQYENARHMLPERIRVVEISSDDAWMRDVGPTFIKNDDGEVRGVDWRFNAWGGLGGGAYFPWDQDALVARKVLEMERVDGYRAPLILEGGSIHVDGEGTLVTTEQCLLNPNRNPDLSKDALEALLKDYLGVGQVIWIPRGVYNDETNGHVDNLCCFTAPGEVLLTWTEDRDDPQYDISREAFDILSKAEDARGRRLNVHTIHQPGPLYMTQDESNGVGYSENASPRKPGHRLAGSYINFYIANGGIVMPLLDEAHDREAMDVIQSLFPDRSVVGVKAREVLLGGGNIHCITQQQPVGRDKS